MFLFLGKSTYPKGFLNFEFWINGELSKIRHYFSNKEMILRKHVLLHWYSSIKKIEKDSDDLEHKKFESQILALFDRSPLI